MIQPSTPIDLFHPAFKADPHPTYAYLREHAPVYRTVMPDGEPMWLVTRYDDVLAVLKDPRFMKDMRNALTPEQLQRLPQQAEVIEALAQNMLDLDAPDHTRLRGIVHKAFSPRLIERLDERIRHIAEELLDEMETKSEVDLLTAYAYPLPITVIAELLGVPKEDHRSFRAWTDAMISGNSVTEQTEVQVAASSELADYMKRHFALRRADPREDLISALVQANDTGDLLSENELLAMAVLLLLAGHETTVNLIANGTLALLQHPDQRTKLEAQPALIGSAVEEMLRFRGPLEWASQRYAGEDVELGGAKIVRGDLVFVSLNSANHDPARFRHPDRLDIERADNRHLAFGQGIHFCLGAPLARLEGQIAISALLRRLPGLRLNAPVESLRWKPHPFLGGLTALPVAY